MILRRPLVSSSESTTPSKLSKGPVLDLDRVADFHTEFDDRLGGTCAFGFFFLAEHAVDFVLVHRNRLSSRSGEITHAARVADEIPGLVVELHVNHHVAGIQLLFPDPPLAPFGLNDLLSGDDDVAEVLFESFAFDPSQERVADRSFPIALNLEDVPLQAIGGRFGCNIPFVHHDTHVFATCGPRQPRPEVRFLFTASTGDASNPDPGTGSG